MPLPHPWQSVVDEPTRTQYYWNSETNATQYERPNADGSNWTPAPAAAQQQQTDQASTKGLSARDQWRKILMKAQQEKQQTTQQSAQQTQHAQHTLEQEYVWGL